MGVLTGHIKNIFLARRFLDKKNKRYATRSHSTATRDFVKSKIF